MAKKRRQRGKRFHFPIYEQLWKRRTRLWALIAIASIGLWWLPYLLSIPSVVYRILAFVPTIVAIFVVLFALVARRGYWVECRSNHLRIQTPIYPLIVSYSRFKTVRPQRLSQVFDPSKTKGIHKNWLLPHWGKTAIIVEISKYPIRKQWLHLVFPPYLLFPQKTPGFVFLVEDWMGLSRQLDDFRNAWEMRRAERRRKRSGPYGA